MGGENRPHGPIFAFAARFVTGCNGRSAKLRAHTFISGLGEVLGKPERVCGCAMFLIMFRSEEHTSELQSRSDLVCRLLLEKKKELQAQAATTVWHLQQHRRLP